MAGKIDYWGILTEPLIRQNPVTLQILGICSALAVTTTLATAEKAWLKKSLPAGQLCPKRHNRYRHDSCP